MQYTTEPKNEHHPERGVATPGSSLAMDFPHLRRRAESSAADQAPYAQDGDPPLEPYRAPYAERRNASQLELGGPEQIASEQIAVQGELIRIGEM